MSPAAFAAALLERGIELIVRNNRLRVWPAHAYHTLTERERAFRREHLAELKALARAGLSTLPDPASDEMKATAVARLRSYDEVASECEPSAATPSEPSRQRLAWDERAQAFVHDLGITI